MKRVVWGTARTIAVTVAALATAAITANAQSPYGLVLHITPPLGFSGCAEIDESTLACEDIVTAGTSLTQQNFVWMFAYRYDQIPGWPTSAADRGLGGAQFGINYSELVDVAAWSLCTGGSEIPQSDFIGDWPASGTGNAVTWAGGFHESTSVDKLSLIGFFVVGAGSEGRVTIQGDPRVDESEIIFTNSGPRSEPWFISNATFSSVNVDGLFPDDGRNACIGPVPNQSTSWGSLKSLF